MSERYGIYELHVVAKLTDGKWLATTSITQWGNADAPAVGLMWGRGFATEAEALSFGISAAKERIDAGGI